MRAWIVVLALLASCAAPIVGSPQREPIEDPPPVLSSEVAAALTDDAQSKLPETVSEVQIAEVEAIVFTDSALGCPEDGVEYARGDIHGFEVVVETDAGHLVYKVDNSGGFMLCVADSSRVAIDLMAVSDNGSHPGGDPSLTAFEATSTLPESLAAAIREDAARIAGVDQSAVTLGDPVRELFSDGSLGCPAKGQSYVQVQTPGWVVMVSAGSMSLEYHAAESGFFVHCP